VNKIGVSLLVAALMVVGSSYGQESIPTRQDREIVMAAVNIGMTEDQRPQFRQTVATFVQDYRSSVLNIMRGNNATHLERKIEKKRQSLTREMDLQMSSFLSLAQMARYETYRELMLTKLTQRDTTDGGDVEELQIQYLPRH